MTEQVKVEREKNAERLNFIVNHESVRPWVATNADGILDMTKYVENERNYLLSGEHGCCLLTCIMEGIYELHTQILPEGRGKWAGDFIHSGAHWMFTHTDAVEILTRVPKNNVAAKMLAERTKIMKLDFTSPANYMSNGELVSVDVYSVHIQNWVKNAPFVAKWGEWFHERISAEIEKTGCPAQPHEDDKYHDRVVGSCVEMCRAGLTRKAAAFYNRWAALTRHKYVYAIHGQPNILRIGLDDKLNGIIRIDDNDFTLLSYEE